MDKISTLSPSDLNFFVNQNIDINFASFLTSLLCAVILCYLVQLFYNRYATTLSNRKEFSKVFVILGVTTSIVIMIVKSSLALSLGLVGALSIVRFRAAIKEPEELVYLFLIIAIGLGCGANQLIIITIGTLFSLLIIALHSKYLKGLKKNLEQKLSVGIIIDQDINDNKINDITLKIKEISKELRFISMSRSENNTTINLDVLPNKFEDLTKFSELIKNEYKYSKVIISYNDDLSL